MTIQEEEKEVELVDVPKEETSAKETTEKTKQNKSSVKKIMGYTIAFIFVLLGILAIILAVFTIYNINHSNIITKNVYIYGVNVSGLTKEEAKKMVLPKFKEMQSKDIELVSGDFTSYLNKEEISLNYDVNSAINYAFNIGKSGNIFTDNYQIFSTMINGINITPTHSLDTSALDNFLTNLSKDLPNAVIESSYYVEDSKLIIVKGTDGYTIDVNKTSEAIQKSIDDFSYLTKPVELILVSSKAKEVDLAAIYQEVHKEPKDASYTQNPFNVYPSETGIDFAVSMEEAQKALNSSEKECEIKLKTTYPKVTTNMIGTEAFPDLLATYSTKFNAGITNRVTNLKLASNKINGTVLMPGETFSYNGIVGKRTVEAGYKEASVYMNGQEVMGLGGGICQVSTTLFNAALLSNLEMVEVHNHQFVPGYSSTGRDATVSWGTKDFQFKNSRNYPIKIVSTISGGTATVQIYGMKEPEEYDVNISVQITAKTAAYTKSATYRTLKQNGTTIKTEKIYNCTYKPH